MLSQLAVERSEIASGAQKQVYEADEGIDRVGRSASVVVQEVKI